MTSSLAGGIIAKGYDPLNITLTDVNDTQLTQVRSQLQVNTGRDNLAARQKADVIVLAVKPQVMAEVIPPLKPVVSQRNPLTISISAGVTLAKLARQ